MTRALSIGVATTLLTVTLVPRATAQTYTPLGASTPLAAQGLNTSFAYDDKHHVYLHVLEYPHAGLWDIYGQFIGYDGSILGAPFAISVNRATAAIRPRVAYSRGSSADAFFVSYEADQVNPANLFGQLLRYTGTGPTGGVFLTGTIAVAPNALQVNPRGTEQRASDVAFNPLTSQFMVAWEDFAGGTASIGTRLFSAFDGSPATAAVNASPKTVPGSQGAPAIAFDWQRNRFLVVYSGDSPTTAGAIGVYCTLIDGSSGALLSPPILLSLGNNVEPAVAYLPEADGFLTAWTNSNVAPRTTNARFVGSTETSGTLSHAEYVAMLAVGQSVGRPALDYDYVSRWVLMSAMRDNAIPTNRYMAGAMLDAGGGVKTGTFLLSTVPPTLTNDAGGAYTPTVRPAENGIFGLSYSNDQLAAEFERFQFPAAQAPGPVYNCVSNCTPPPPPPPPTDTDGDGVPDSTDACPTVFAQTANGCPVTPASVAGDFNGDSKPEIIWQNANTPGTVVAWFLNGLAFSSSTVMINDLTVPAGWIPVAEADFNGDGKADILWHNELTGQILLFVMNGTTKVAEQAIGAADPAWHIMGAADFNGDGHPDILWQNYASGQLFIWFMTSNNGVASTMNPFLGINVYSLQPNGSMTIATLGDKTWRVVGVADLNGDGKPDLIWQHPTGNLSGWYMSGALATSAIDVPFNDPTWRVRGVGDLNGDGHPDLLFQKTDTGDISTWLLGPNAASATGVALGRVQLQWTIVGPK